MFRVYFSARIRKRCLTFLVASSQTAGLIQSISSLSASPSTTNFSRRDRYDPKTSHTGSTAHCSQYLSEVNVKMLLPFFVSCQLVIDAGGTLGNTTEHVSRGAPPERRDSSLTEADAGGWGRTRGRAVCRCPKSARTRIMRRPVGFQARRPQRKDARVSAACGAVPSGFAQGCRDGELRRHRSDCCAKQR